MQTKSEQHFYNWLKKGYNVDSSVFTLLTTTAFSTVHRLFNGSTTHDVLSPAGTTPK